MASACPPEGTAQVQWIQVGPCQVWINYTAQGVYPDCNGTIEFVVIRNDSFDSWTVRIPRAGKAGGRLYTIPPATTAGPYEVLVTKQQCNARGYDQLSEMLDLLPTLG